MRSHFDWCARLPRSRQMFNIKDASLWTLLWRNQVLQAINEKLDNCYTTIDPLRHRTPWPRRHYRHVQHVFYYAHQNRVHQRHYVSLTWLPMATTCRSNLCSTFPSVHFKKFWNAIREIGRYIVKVVVSMTEHFNTKSSSYSINFESRFWVDNS